MFHPSVKRLIWKEFRAQWQVWVALLIGALLLQLLHVTPGSMFARMGEFPFMVALVLTFCFAATCGALLFAGEREESTFGLLRSMPLSTTRLASVKLLFAVGSVVLFGIGSACLSALVAAIHPNPSSFGNRITFEELFKGYLPGILGCLLWSMFYSLLLSRVMVVIVCAVVTEFAVTGLITNPLTDYTLTHIAVRLGFYVMLAVVDLWLMGRWWRNEPVSLPWAGRSTRASRRDGRSFDVSLRVVRWASARHTLGMRTFAVLIWRELRAAVPFVFCWSLLGLLMVDVAVRFDLFPGNFVYLLATPVVCGLMTCLGDQRQQTYRFLGERGLSGPSVWLSKHVVWLSVAVGLVVMFGFYDEVFGRRIPEYPRRGAERSVASVIDKLSSAQQKFFHLDPQAASYLAVASVFWLGMLFYAVGHLCSLWLRRAVVAVAAAGVVAAMLLFWMAISLQFDVPLLISVGPLVVAGFVGTLTTMGGWLQGDTSWSRLCKQAAWIVLPTIIAISGALGYRMTQIPEVDPGFDWRAWENRPVASPVWMSEWETALMQLSTRSDHLRILRDGVDEIDVAEDFGGWEEWESTAPRRTEVVTKSFEELREDVMSASTTLEQLLDARTLPPPVLMYASNESISPNLSTLQAAIVLQERGYLEDAFQVLRTSLRVSTFTNPSMPTHEAWLVTFVKQQQILAFIRRWANDEQQTVEQLDEAVAWFDKHAGETIVPTDGLRNQYVYYRKLLSQQGPQWENQIHNTSAPYAFSSPMYGVERQRMLRLLNVVTRYHLERQLSNPFSTDVTPQQIDRWGASATMFDPRLHDFVQGYGGVERAVEHHQQLVDAIHAAHQATQLIMRLQAYRMREGHFPERLDQLPGDRVNSLMLDPLGGQPFGYSPVGIQLSDEESQKYQLASGQPVLYSTGWQLPGLILMDGTYCDRIDGQPDATAGERVKVHPEKIVLVILPAHVLGQAPASPF
ncbi:MAG: ABC transporter permease [Planctomycetaceae bacterium]|nr:ABC transporter permease [Planctomycetaceae bacterium]